MPLKLASALKLGPPTLRVRELDRMLGFYEKDVGLQVKERRTGPDGLEAIGLGFMQKAEPLLVLKNDPRATRPPHDSAGLYHYAVLVPERKDLASTFLAVGNSGVAYEGYADHTFSEAIYLHDAEHNGIEFYADRPRSSWPHWDGMTGGARGYQRFASLNGPLDLDSLLKELTAGERTNPVPFPHGAGIGHMHLRVTNLQKSVEFYHSRLGFDITMYFPEIRGGLPLRGRIPPSPRAEHMAQQGRSAAQAGEIGLEEFRIRLPSADDLAAVSERFPEFSRTGRTLTIRDPDDLAIVFES